MSTIKKYRDAVGMTQEKLAEAIHTSQSQIVKLEKNQRSVNKKWAQRIAPVLGVHAARLIFTEQELSNFLGLPADKSDRDWKIAIIDAANHARKQGASIEEIHNELQAKFPLSQEQVISRLSLMSQKQQKRFLGAIEKLNQP